MKKKPKTTKKQDFSFPKRKWVRKVQESYKHSEIMSELRHLGAGPDSWPGCVLRFHRMSICLSMHLLPAPVLSAGRPERNHNIFQTHP